MIIAMNEKKEKNTNSLTNSKKFLTKAQKARILRYLAIANLSEFWIKFGNSLFYKAYLTGNDLVLRRTKINYDLGLEGNERSLTRTIGIDKDSVIPNGLDYAFQKSLTFTQKVKDSDGTIREVGGVFFGCADGQSDFPLKEFQQTSTQIVTEIDDLPRDGQLEVYQWLQDISGLKFYLLTSGSKSIHLHIISDTPLPIEKIIYLRRLLCLVIDGDPAVARHHQPFRFPEMFRAEKGNIQEILQVGESYSYNQILDCLKKAFKAKGLRFPESISDAWWSGELLPILNSDKKNKAKKAKPITKEEKLERLTNALDCGEKVFFEKRKKNQKVRLEKAQNYKSSFDNISDSDKERLALELLDHIPSKNANDGLYEDYRSIFTAIKNIVGLTRAVAIADSHSPKSSGWGQVLESSTGKFTIGTIIYYAKKWGGYNPHNDSDYDYDSQYGKVILSGKDAIARAKSSLSEDDLREHQIISLAEFEEMLEREEFTRYQERFIRAVNRLTEGKQKGFADRFIKIPLNFKDEIIFDPATFYLISTSDISSDTKLFIPKQYQDPKIYAQIITYLNYIGLKHIFLKLQAGQGKSTCMGYLDKILYIDVNYNNPSNPLIKDFHSLTPRSEHGIYEVNGVIKVDPEKKIRDKADQPDSGVIKLKDGNCELKSVFRAFQNKGYSAEGNKAICEKCKSNKTCAVVSGGFRHETKRDMSIIAHKLQGSSHPAQVTVEKLNDVFASFIKGWEEASTLPINSDYLYSELTIRRLRSAVENIVKNTPDFNYILAEYLLTSLDFLSDILDPTKAKLLTEDNRFFGLPHEIITSNLPPLDASIIDGFLDNDIQHLLSILCPDIAELVPYYRDKSELALKVEELANNLDTSPYHLLMALLFGNDSQYCISSAKVEKRGGIEWQLMVTEPVTKWGQLAKAGGNNVYLDATATPTQIKAIFDIEDDTPFLTIVNEVNELDNLLIRNINLKGLGSNTWSQDAIDRAKKGVALIKEQNPEKKIAVMTLKKYAEEFNTPFWYGKSDRGSNELIGYDGIIFVGSPFPDVGACNREYVSLYKNRKDKPTFDQFYSQKRYEQRMQGLARLRAQHSKDKQFFQYYLTTNEDLSYLEEIGVKYETIEGAILSPELGSRGDKTFAEICTIAQNFVNSGIDFTLATIAKGVGISKQAVSKAIKRVCNGFEEFKRCQLNLYNYYIGLVDERMRFSDFTNDIDPQDLIEYAIDGITRNRSEGFLDVVIAFDLPKHIAFRLLWLVSGVFDPRIPDSFLTAEIVG